ncbi:Hypothetical predicted protein [Mytilus galloprovincialis]|uniref:BEN domain-containing protein n=1 Tax=Mytilus galloprovincialis TaxID=29158 RepID=A0A8B6F279_MYTGA|nr:Hypothetical predicted protein [Mytilus galloprovincialis]
MKLVKISSVSSKNCFGRTSYRGRNVPNNIEEAILSVTSGKLNQSQAAQKYGVTQPTISQMSQGRADSMFEFRLKKHTQYIPENLEKAVEAVLSALVKKRPRTKHKMYSRENLEKALEAVMSGRFSAVPGRLRTTLESVLHSGTDDMTEQSIKEGDQVELHQNTGVYCNLWQLNKICQASVKEPSKMIRCLLELYFDDQYLADHCAKGRLPFGSSNPADSRPAIDSVVLGAIKGFVCDKFPSVSESMFHQLVNSKCSDSRKRCKSRIRRLQKYLT